MSIYGDEGAGDTMETAMASASKSGARGPLDLGAKWNVLTAEQKKQVGIGAGAVALVLVVWYFSSSDCAAESGGMANIVLPTTTDADGTVHFITSPIPIAQNEHAKVSLPTDYEVSFDLTPGAATVDEWSNIVHFSASGDNCCSYGDRVPGVWFYPGTRRLHIIDGHGADDGGNDECAIEDELVPGTSYNIRVSMRQHYVEVFYNNVMKCTEPRKDRRVFATAQVFASDPWYEPAVATIANLVMKPLAPLSGCNQRSACNYDVRASIDDGSCRPPSYGQDCNGNAISNVGAGVTTIVQGSAQLVRHAPLVGMTGDWEYGAPGRAMAVGQNSRGSYHAVVSLPMDYSVSFSITPQQGTVEVWANIVHFTATMTNCCEYGDRIPGIWFHPGTRRLHIRDGMDSEGNAGCDPMSELSPGQRHDVQVDIGQNGVEVKIDGAVVCGRVASARRPWQNAHVFVSDPWHPAALAMIENLRISPLQGHPGCMIDAACNRDFTASTPDHDACVFPHSRTDCTGRHAITFTDHSQNCVLNPADGSGCGYTMEAQLSSAPTSGFGAGGAQIQAYVPPGSSSSFGGAPTGGTGGLHSVLNIPLDYRISFDITPGAGVEQGWSNIFHISATGSNCCTYGDRVPGVWFYPASRRLHVVHGHRDSGNDHCSPEEELVAGRPTNVKIEVRQKHVEVFFNGASRCTEPRGVTQSWNAAHLYISDIWYPPAIATLANFQLEQLVPVLGCGSQHACNYNPRAAVDDGSCRFAAPGTDCTGRNVGAADGTGTTAFLSGSRRLAGGPSCSSGPTGPACNQLHAVVNLQLDYTVSFTLTPEYDTVESWSSIVHFTATGNDCCSYGDRAPAVWFYPGQHRLHIIDGQPSVGNDECVIRDELQPNRPYAIRIAVHERSVAVSIDGVQKCQEPRAERQKLSNVHVYASDPWYEPAHATIADLTMTSP